MKLFFTILICSLGHISISQETKFGIPYLIPEIESIEGLKIHFSSAYTERKKTHTRIHLVNKSPTKIFYFDWTKKSFYYPKDVSMEYNQKPKWVRELHNGKSLIMDIFHKSKKFNHQFDRFRLEIEGLKMGTPLENQLTLEPIALKNLKDTIIKLNGIVFHIKKTVKRGNKITCKLWFYIDTNDAQFKNYLFNRQKIKFLDHSGEKVKGPRFYFRQITLDSTKKERLRFKYKFDKDAISMDFTEAIVPIKIQDVQLLPVHFFAKAPFGHEVRCQDKIEFKDGTIIFGTVARLTKDLVAFRNCEDGPMSESYDFTEVPRSDLKQITYSNGEIDDFENNNDNISEKYVKTMIEIHKLTQ